MGPTSCTGLHGKGTASKRLWRTRLTWVMTLTVDAGEEEKKNPHVPVSCYLSGRHFCPCISCATAEEHVAVGKQTRCQKYGFLLLVTGAVFASKNVQVELSLGTRYCIYVRLSRDGCDPCSA